MTQIDDGEMTFSRKPGATRSLSLNRLVHRIVCFYCLCIMNNLCYRQIKISGKDTRNGDVFPVHRWNHANIFQLSKGRHLRSILSERKLDGRGETPDWAQRNQRTAKIKPKRSENRKVQKSIPLSSPLNKFPV